MGLENMDVHRVDCENLDIKAWAQQIREIKIREIRELIVEKENAIRNTNFETEDYMSVRRVHALSDISRLNRKLSILTK